MASWPQVEDSNECSPWAWPSELFCFLGPCWTMLRFLQQLPRGNFDTVFVFWCSVFVVLLAVKAACLQDLGEIKRTLSNEYSFNHLCHQWKGFAIYLYHYLGSRCSMLLNCNQIAVLQFVFSVVRSSYNELIIWDMEQAEVKLSAHAPLKWKWN